MSVKQMELYDYLQQKAPGQWEQRVRIQEYKKGVFVYSPPQRLRYICELVAGAVKLGCYTDEATEFTYEVLKPGDFFGNFQYLNGPFAEFSKTLAPTTVRCYDLSLFKDMIIQHPQIAEWFVARLTSRWCSSETKLVHIGTLEPRQRIKQAYQLFNKPVMDSSTQNHMLAELLTFKDIADLTGTTRQLVAQVLRDVLIRTTKPS